MVVLQISGQTGAMRRSLALRKCACDSAAAMSGILKGKLEEIDDSSPCSSLWESDDEVFSCDSAASVDSVSPSTSHHFTESIGSEMSPVAGKQTAVEENFVCVFSFLK
ncbi:hypothetical protein CB1_000846006 [Camelus ferus]|nr:hypothetical protein CB1_000846006 [Camelus ferus]